jgi:cyclophilin family peptidyl-prolyl cis-trans isomerase
MIEPVMARLLQENPNDVRFVYRHFPLISIHDKAALATQAAEAAGLQGKFWEMHKLLFEKQQEWSGLDVEKFKEWLATKAAELGLDKEQFTKDLTSEKIVKIAQGAYDESVKLGLPGTPTLAINGVYYGGDMSYESLSAYIKKLGTVKTFDGCPPMTIDPKKKYIATLQLEKGDIEIQLFADKAPVTVNSFVFLARQGWYNGVTFHRVISDFVAQAGDPYGTGSGGPGYEFINEIASGLTFGEMGVVGMANAGPDTNGSQFFITFEGIPDETVAKLDGKYTIFGKVIKGMDVVNKLTPRDPSQNPNLPPGDEIKSITIQEQ